MMLLRHSLLLLVLLAGCKTTDPTRIGEVVRHDSRFAALIPKNARVEKLAEGFEWSEGPVWVPSGQYLLFSDIPVNTIYR